ncbi:hypothetical protein Taro_038715 [Colocasia esculenta]|uniref:AB hydrolase-1 domain-containing protein n=1 Tax=Colocasia esculenta TaxID=4460 RepID=A0A843WK29_COLES|nr:hypothetical protein [Colocasia esculenta]
MEWGEKKHFVLAHGACHGAWSWYKVATLLRAAGHTVTAPDLGACGADARRLDEVGTFSEYAQPLMEVMSALPPGERVVLVGHSFGGLSVSVAAERFPEKVSAVVFLAAFMPDTSLRPSYVMEEYLKKFPLPWMDTQVSPLNRGANKEPIASFLFGPKFTSSRLYQLCPPQDITLGLSLMRVGSLFLEDLSRDLPFSETKYGSVKKVYIVCGEDLAIPKAFQLWMTENYAVDEVKVVGVADHMPMMSMPEELCRSLEDVAVVYT